MATISWTSSAGGDWSVGSNWQGGVVPGAEDDVAMNISAAETITVSTTQQANSIAMTDPAATFVIASTGMLDVAGNVTLTVGAAQLDGEIDSGGTIDIAASNFISVGMLRAGTVQLASDEPIPILGGATTVATGIVSDGGLLDTVIYAEPNGSLVLSILCFARGTRIETETGHRAVEALAVGDCVRLVSGDIAPISWIGHRRVDCRRHPTPERVNPIRILRHAFGEDRPMRMLLLSPDHSVFVEDVLIPVKFLMNGTTVAQIDARTIFYYHIELARHDVVLAEGLPVETYLETGSRAAFENGRVAVQLHPDFAPDDDERVAAIWRRFGYAPLLGVDGQLERVRARLEIQARMLEYRAFGKRRKRLEA